MLCLLPSLHSLPGTHTSMLSVLATVTDHLSPNSVSILLLREPAELLISSHVLSISIHFFRWTVLPQLI